jgi:WXG100 family type VII secretion target
VTDGRFAVDLDHLDRVVARLTGLTGFLNDTFDAIDRQVKTLHSGSWDGAAARTHAEAHRAWLGAAQEFAQGVADVTAAAKQAHARYTEGVDVNTRMVKS